MSIQYFPAVVHDIFHSGCRGVVGNIAGVPFDSDSALAVTAARTRLSTAARRSQRQKSISANGTYYGERTQLEETIDNVGCIRAFDAVVTRNHYGSLVLNAAHALFIDVDMLQASRAIPPIDLSRQRWQGAWRQTLDDLRTVLTGELEEGFRIYRTAAGFRILATTHEFEPGSRPSNRLMNIVGADSTFMHLCRIQNSFRARLTPKPWRCGAVKPPNSFPRESAEDRYRFADWLSRYERACRDRATCQYLERVGPDRTHERIRSVIQFHDRMTGAFQTLALA